MQAVRHLLAQRHLAVLICVGALLMKLLVPTGYMIDGASGRITLCGDAGPATTMMAMPAMHGDTAGHGSDHGKSKEHKSDMPCAFAGLSFAMLGATDPIQLAALIAFVLALGLVATVPPTPSRSAYLRPPLRGPPAIL